MHRGYSRPKIIHHESDETDISEYAKFRLFLARTLALRKLDKLRNQA